MRPKSTQGARPPSRPQTARTVATTAAEGGQFVVAVLPARGTREVGVVSLDVDSGHVQLTQFTDAPTWVKTLHLCRARNPKAVVLPQSALSSTMTRNDEADEDAGVATGGSAETAMLVDGLKREFPDMPLVAVLRKYWNEQAGFEFLKQLAVHDDERMSTLNVCKSKWYALSATAALFQWLDSAQSVSFPPNSLRIRYAPLEGTCLIDSESARNLELVANLLNKNSKQHLLGMLNKCFTPMGTRHLRANILSPLTDPDTIDARLDAVEELVNSEERFRAVRKALEPLKSLDLDKIVSRLLAPVRAAPTAPSSTRTSLFPRTSASQDPSTRISQHLSYLLSLRTFLSTVPKLRASVEHADARLLQAVERALEDPGLKEIARVVEAGVNPDVWAVQSKGRKGSAGGAAAGGAGMVGRHARLFAIKAERKLLLDVARETYRENLSDAYDLLEALRVRFSLEGVQIVQVGGGGSSGGFVFVLGKDEWEEKKGEMGRAVTNVTVKGKKVEFSSLELKKRNARLQDSVQEILMMSEEILEEMFGEIRGFLGCLYKAAEVIAMLDMIAAFAEVSSKNEYVRPEWTDTLAIKAGRHPLHEQFRMSDGSFVPNDTYASDAASFQLIYGANMSGKSTLLRQIALLHIMAQIGCFVPALYVSFRPISALLTRLSNDDDLAASLSTFASEMSTMSMILGALGAHDGACLVLVDELGRGTSPEEGVGIAHAIAEEIIKSKAFCFFATHFKELALTLPSRYPNVVALHLEAEIDESQPDFSLTFHHKVRDGATPLTHYGFELAKLAKLPPRVLRSARIASLTLESLAADGRARSAEGKLARRRRGLLELTTRLKELAAAKTADAEVLRKLMQQTQDEAVRMLAETMPLPAADDGRARTLDGGEDCSESVEQAGGTIISLNEELGDDGESLGWTGGTAESLETEEHGSSMIHVHEDEVAEDEDMLAFD